MRPCLRPRRGMALATALAAMVVIGVLIAGAFFVSNQEYRIGRGSLSGDRALTAAEFGQNALLRDWDMSWNGRLKVGDTVKKVYTNEAGALDTVVATRIRENMFWVASTGRSSSDAATGARRRTGLLVRMNVPTMPFPGAFTSAKSVVAAGNYVGSGADAAPTAWTDCPPPVDPIAAIASVSTANISFQGNGCSGAGCLTGNPKTLGTPDAGDAAKILDGWDDLVSRADKIFNASGTPLTQTAPSINADGTCKTTDIKNWGDPARAVTAGICESYFPIVYIRSTIAGSGGTTQTISNGVGQGILLVDGNLSLSGGFEWIGPVIVKGNVSTSGNGNKVTGGIEALNLNCTAVTCNSLSGTSAINYSSCALTRILNLKAYPTVAKEHAWADLF